MVSVVQKPATKRAEATSNNHYNFKSGAALRGSPLYFMSATIQINIEATEAEQEILISELSAHDALGFEQTSDRLIAYFKESSFPAYEVNALLDGREFSITTLQEQNWNALWESNFEPVVIDGFCAVRAEFHAPAEGVEHEIIITPKMSFGTGHHATTHMMISFMGELSFEKKTVFDFGTGTGILAILASMLGASEVAAIDIDEWSIENAKENAERNNCSAISLALSTELPSNNFDVVLANINRNVILDYLPQFPSLVKKGGYLLLSGLLVEDEAAVRPACEKEGFLFENRKERNNWISLLFVKPS